MISQHLRDIKQAKKETALMRELSTLLLQLQLDEPNLKDLYINRVKLSADKGLCTVFFYTAEGESVFKEKLNLLILYKPSLRTALAKAFSSRYTPELVFRFDEQFEKQQRIESLLEQIKADTEEEK